MARQIIQQGAEAILYREGDELVKDRIQKGYRLPEMDARIRKLRTRTEARILDMAAREGVSVPRVLRTEENVLRMEFIEGLKAKDALNSLEEPELEKVWAMIGKAAAKLHSAGIMHGDLTTSNMIVTQIKNGKTTDKSTLFLIDFGLSRLSGRVEDLAVDLYLLYDLGDTSHFAYVLLFSDEFI